MIARAEAAGAEIAVDNLEVVKAGAARNHVRHRHFSKRSPELDLADFIAANIMFEDTFSFGYMKPIFERRFWNGTACATTRRCASARTTSCWPRRWPRAGAASSNPSVGYAYHIRDGSISRVLELHHVEAMLKADAAFVREHRLDAEAGRAGAAHPQPETGGVLLAAGPASEGPGAVEGGRCGAARSGGVAPSENADRGAAAAARIVAAAGQAAPAPGDENILKSAGARSQTGMSR